MKKIYILVLIMLVIVGWSVFSNNKNKSTPSSSTQTPQVVQNTSDINAPTLGDKNAPVTIVEYGHFKCPFCNRFFRETEPKIVNTYIKTGKVKLVWKDFPFEEGLDLQKAHQAAYCANNQGKFWEYHDTLFSYIWDNYYAKKINAEEENVFTDFKLKELASQIGLDTAKFNNCLDLGTYEQLVKDNYNEGIARGVKSTPTFFINGQKIVGAQPFSVFSQVIDSKLK